MLAGTGNSLLPKASSQTSHNGRAAPQPCHLGGTLSQRLQLVLPNETWSITTRPDSHLTPHHTIYFRKISFSISLSRRPHLCLLISSLQIAYSMRRLNGTVFLMSAYRSRAMPVWNPLHTSFTLRNSKKIVFGVPGIYKLLSAPTGQVAVATPALPLNCPPRDPHFIPFHPSNLLVLPGPPQR